MKRWIDCLILFIKLQPQFWKMAGCYVDMRTAQHLVAGPDGLVRMKKR